MQKYRAKLKNREDGATVRWLEGTTVVDGERYFLGKDSRFCFAVTVFRQGSFGLVWEWIYR